MTQVPTVKAATGADGINRGSDMSPLLDHLFPHQRQASAAHHLMTFPNIMASTIIPAGLIPTPTTSSPLAFSSWSSPGYPMPMSPQAFAASSFPTSLPFPLPRLSSAGLQGFPSSSLITAPVISSLGATFNSSLAMAFQAACSTTNDHIGSPLAPIIDPSKLGTNFINQVGTSISPRPSSSLKPKLDHKTSNGKRSSSISSLPSEQSMLQTSSVSPPSSPGGSTTAGSSSVLDPPRKRKRISKKQRRRMNGEPEDSAEREFNGEERLAIQFETYGSVDPSCPVKLGAHKGYIPNGLSGCFNMYAERWAFEVRYASAPVLCRDGKKRIPIEWAIKSFPHWKEFHRVVETADEAQTRETRGFTLCNRVFREAMQKRAEEYERLAAQEEQSKAPNPLQIANYQRQAVFLRPEKVSEGPLLFGLRHKTIQDRVKLLVTGCSEHQSEKTVLGKVPS